MVVVADIVITHVVCYYEHYVRWRGGGGGGGKQGGEKEEEQHGVLICYSGYIEYMLNIK